MKAILYRRVSSVRQADDEKDGLTRQTRLCEEHAGRMGWEIDPQYVTDAGKSAFHGTNLKGELGRIIADAEAGRLKNTVIVAEKIDRLSRLKRAEGYAVIQRLVKAGVFVAIVDGNLLYNPNATLAEDIMLLVKLEVANEESQKKQDRTLSARQAVYDRAVARTGKWTRAVPQPPEWLKANEAENDWIIDQAKADIVRSIYAMSANGLGATHIAKKIRGQGDTRFGEEWTRRAVVALLKARSPEGVYAPRRSARAGQEIIDFYPRIVDPAVVIKARQMMTSRSTTAVFPRKNYRNLISGMVFCHDCGATAVYRTATRASKKSGTKVYQYLHCTKASEGLCHNTHWHDYDTVEANLLHIAFKLDLLDLEDHGNDVASAIAELEFQIAAVERKRGRVLDLIVDGDELVRGKFDELSREKNELLNRKSDLERASVARQSPPIFIDNFDLKDDEVRARIQIGLRRVVNRVELRIHEPLGIKQVRIKTLGGRLEFITYGDSRAPDFKEGVAVVERGGLVIPSTHPLAAYTGTKEIFGAFATVNGKLKVPAE